jgi:hypothetical protein
MRTTTLRRFALPLALGAAALVGGTPAVALDWGLGMPVSSGSTLYVPIRVSPSFRLEPFIYSQSSEDKVGGFAVDRVTEREIGLGLFLTDVSGELNWYRGLRFSVFELSHNQAASSSSPASQTSSNGVIFAPVVGIEYQLLPQASIAAETYIDFQEQSSSGGWSHTSHRTRTHLFVRYMF